MKKLLFLTLGLMLLAFSPRPFTTYCGPYTFHAPITMNGASNQTISGDSLSSITLTNCSNIHITNCKISNNPTGIAINLSNCTNITIDYNVIELVGQGVLVKTSTGTRTEHNYFHNILGSQNFTWHPVQYQNCNGGGQDVMYNMIEEDPIIAPYTHDQISIYQSNGLPGDSIVVAYNTLRGGQQIKNAAGNNGAAALGVGDSGGSYQSVHDNKMVNALAIAIDGAGTSLHVYHNFIYAQQVAPQPVSVGIVYFGAPGNNRVENNIINFRTPTGGINNINPSSSSVAGWGTNTQNSGVNTLANAAMIPTPQVAPCAGGVAPTVTYTSPVVRTVGQTISLSPSVTGTPISFSISPAAPAGTSFNTSTGLLSGTLTTVKAATNYTVTMNTSSGSVSTVINITVNTAPIAPPFILYTSPQTYTAGTTINPLTPSNSGGAVTSWIGSVPTGLSLNTTTGQITGTPIGASPSTSYKITAMGPGGSNAYTTNITVNVAPTVPLPVPGYVPSTYTFTYGTAITAITPVNSGAAATRWSIAPAIEPGLGFNTSTGQITGTPTAASTARTHTVTATNGGGSAITTVTIAVNKVNLSVSVSNATRAFGSANPAFSLSYAGFVGGDDVSSLTTRPIGSTVANTGSNVGTYPITISGGAAANYNFIYGSATLTITRVPLTVTANNRTVSYGSAFPPFTASYSGFVNGNTAASLITQPVVTTTATHFSPVGTYTLNIAGASSPNYTITYVPGTLTQARIPITVRAQNASRNVNTANPAFTVTYSGFSNGQGPSVLSSKATVSTSANTGSPAGTYALVPSGAAASNYTFIYVNGILTVSGAPQPPSHSIPWRRKVQH